MVTVFWVESFQKTLEGAAGEFEIVQVTVAALPVSVVAPTAVIERMLAVAVSEIISPLTVNSHVYVFELVSPETVSFESKVPVEAAQGSLLTPLSTVDPPSFHRTVG